jgi:ArsR family transcriptional regulator
MMMSAEPGVSCSELLKALADETRLAVVCELMRGERHAGELLVATGVEQSLLSHHLRQLREAGIVESERDGKSVLYRLAPGVECRRRGNVVDLGCCQLAFNKPGGWRP